MRDILDAFWNGIDVDPDPFQIEAAEAVRDGSSVVVTAPTGSGKTLVAEAAIHLALVGGKRSLYTTPIKALSNQKYADLVHEHGADRVGLMTGDNVINGDASVVVMTTEVLRNMIYSGTGGLEKVGVVILDEVHYLQDPSRGAVWEEVIIHCPQSAQLVCLSATVSNHTQFAAWVGERRGHTVLVTADTRPIPLESLYMIKDRSGSGSVHLMPTFVTREGRRRPNPRIERMLSMERGRRRRFKTPSRADVVESLASEEMLPAIYFIFSRAGCDAAAHRLVDSGVRLTTSEEQVVIRDVVARRTAHLGDGDLEVLGYERWITGLEAGVASHHAGLVPAFKETVEELFGLGVVKVVFATETLALGINMPARTVVLESLSKFDGESHQTLRPGDYTQLTGRAGRRGIDVEGFGVVLHSPFIRFRQVTEVAHAGSHELRSSFRATYNMTANLVANYPQEEAEALLEASFAAFQREGRRHDEETRIEDLEQQLARANEQAGCERGSVEEYLDLYEAASPGRRGASLLSSGDVVDVVGGARDGRYAVIKRLSSKGSGERYLVLSTSGRVTTMGSKQITDSSRKVGAIKLPVPLRPRERRFVQEALRRLRKVPASRSEPTGRRAVVGHPVADCPDAQQHLSAQHKANRLRRRISQHRALQRSYGFGLVEELHAIRELLEELEYLRGWSLTPRGERLRAVFNETDLLLTESIERGYLHGLEPAELAALVSSFVYEPRLDRASPSDWPTEELSLRWEDVDALWRRLTRREQELGLSPTRSPDPGFGTLAYQWAGGAAFDDLPRGAMAAGDFVRVSRQLADLLRQIRDAVPELRDDTRAALTGVDRGVVAAQGVGW